MYPASHAIKKHKFASITTIACETIPKNSQSQQNPCESEQIDVIASKIVMVVEGLKI